MITGMYECTNCGPKEIDFNGNCIPRSFLCPYCKIREMVLVNIIDSDSLKVYAVDF